MNMVFVRGAWLFVAAFDEGRASTNSLSGIVEERGDYVAAP